MVLTTWGFPRSSQPSFPCCRLRATVLTGLSQGHTSTSSNFSSPANRPADFAIPSLCHLGEDWSPLSASYGEKKKKKPLILATSDPEQGHPLCTYMKQVCLCSAPPPPECFPVCMESVRPPRLPSPEHSFLSPPSPPLVVAANSKFSSLQQLCWAADNTSE